jgi:hypothetical protein
MAANRMEFVVTPWGRGTMEVIQRAVWKLESGEGGLAQADRATLIPDLEAAAGTPQLRKAVPTIVTYLDRTYDGTAKAGVWGGAHTALVRAGMAADIMQADRLVNEFCFLFMKTHPKVLLAEWKETILIYAREFMGISGPGWRSIHFSIFSRDVTIVAARDNAANLPPEMQRLSMVRRSSDYLTADRNVLESSYIRLANQVTDAGFSLAVAVLLLLGALARKLDANAISFTLAGFLTALLYVFVVSFLLVFIPRYVLPYQVVIAGVLGLLAARLATPKGDPAGVRSASARQFASV